MNIQCVIQHLKGIVAEPMEEQGLLVWSQRKPMEAKQAASRFDHENGQLHTYLRQMWKMVCMS
jgi:hypothetical protein